MYSCLIVSHPENSKRSSLLQNILDQSLKDIPFKKQRLATEEYIMITNASLSLTWQTALNLECLGFPVSYGFGDSEEIATVDALEKWMKRNFVL